MKNILLFLLFTPVLFSQELTILQTDLLDNANAFQEVMLDQFISQPLSEEGVWFGTVHSWIPDWWPIGVSDTEGDRDYTFHYNPSDGLIWLDTNLEDAINITEADTDNYGYYILASDDEVGIRVRFDSGFFDDPPSVPVTATIIVSSITNSSDFEDMTLALIATILELKDIDDQDEYQYWSTAIYQLAVANKFMEENGIEYSEFGMEAGVFVEEGESFQAFVEGLLGFNKLFSLSAFVGSPPVHWPVDVYIEVSDDIFGIVLNETYLLAIEALTDPIGTFITDIIAPFVENLANAVDNFEICDCTDLDEYAGYFPCAWGEANIYADASDNGVILKHFKNVDCPTPEFDPWTYPYYGSVWQNNFLPDQWSRLSVILSQPSLLLFFDVDIVVSFTDIDGNYIAKNIMYIDEVFIPQCFVNDNLGCYKLVDSFYYILEELLFFDTQILIQIFDNDEGTLLVEYSAPMNEGYYAAVYGCTDPTALNFDPEATVACNGDNSCCDYELEVGLVAFYPFNGNAIDESGNGLNGAVNGAQPTTNRFGIPNSALYFDGINDNVVIPDVQELNCGYNENITVAIWVQTTSSGVPISKYSSASPSGGYLLSCPSGNYPSFQGRDRSGYYWTGPGQTPISDGDWHFILGMRNGTIWSYWFDGVLEASVNSGNVESMDNPYPINIGNHIDHGTQNSWFNASLDDVHIYNRALSESEINELYCENGWCEEPVLGCTDPSALNFCFDCTVDDGSCEYEAAIVLGDIDSDGLTNVVDIVLLVDYILSGDQYFETADLNSNGSLDVVDVVILVDIILNPWKVGCTDSLADNYNHEAIYEDGTCLYSGSCIDIDGNEYATVIIGEQEWMAVNLKTTHYNNGDPIPTGFTNSQWSNLLTGAYSIYEGVESNAEIYGNLYNWYTIGDNRGICPEGFHVPSDEEWIELEMTLGMSDQEAHNFGYRGTNEGSKLAGNAELWNDGILVSNDEFGSSGFMSIPGGYRLNNGVYHNLGNRFSFWSDDSFNSTNSLARRVYYYNTQVNREADNKQIGFSIRCVGD